MRIGNNSQGIWQDKYTFRRSKAFRCGRQEYAGRFAYRALQKFAWRGRHGDNKGQQPKKDYACVRRDEAVCL